MDIDLTSVFISKLSDEMKKTRSSRAGTPGFSVDIGAPKYCIGLKELKSVFASFGLRIPQLKWSPNCFRFVELRTIPLGRLYCRLQYPPGKPTIFVEMDVVKADIPALLGLDLLDRESLIADTVANRLKKRGVAQDGGSFFHFDEWQVPLLRSKSGYVYVEMDCSTSMMFTRSRLTKFHKQFFHPSAEKLFNLLKRRRPEETSFETLEVLQELSNVATLASESIELPHVFGSLLAPRTFGSTNGFF